MKKLLMGLIFFLLMICSFKTNEKVSAADDYWANITGHKRKMTFNAKTDISI